MKREERLFLVLFCVIQNQTDIIQFQYMDSGRILYFCALIAGRVLHTPQNNQIIKMIIFQN